MAILNFPTGIIPTLFDITLETKTQSYESELSGARQTASLPGSRWLANLTFANQTGIKADTLRAFLLSLGGVAGQFYMPAFDHPTPTGTALGAGLVKGGGQTGKTINTDGWTANQAIVLSAGDYIQIGNGLYMVTANAASDGTGQATLSIAPELKASPADNTPIVTNRPCGVFQLVDDRQCKFAQQPGRIYAISISVREVINA